MKTLDWKMLELTRACRGSGGDSDEADKVDANVMARFERDLNKK